MTSNEATIEGRIFRKMNMTDGLMDIYLGIMLIPYSIWIYYPDFSIGAVLLPFVAFALAYPVYLHLKKRFVAPRVGSVKPGPIRRKKMHILVTASIVGLVLTVALVLATAFASEAAVQVMAGIPRVFWIFSLCVIGATTLTAWIASTPRLAVYGLLVAVSIPVDAVFILRSGNLPTTLIPVLIMIVTGIVLFIRFLDKYPVHTEVY